ncbi:hypothetical protein IQ26_04939 [Mesorhizobium tianshanense]|uniref:Uncharacterized protein n=1 Tax=Mesorhizobium tianshanense TaxID=39844 RepID=A0A562NCH2_9HYPH|nr:hypothetical protein IQ26_04939 [Mesorhizobium tianshanense]
MGSFSVFHWLILLIFCALLIVPYWRIFPRAGWPSALSILMVVPLLNFVLLWVLAFKKWPGDA